MRLEELAEGSRLQEEANEHCHPVDIEELGEWLIRNAHDLLDAAGLAEARLLELARGRQRLDQKEGEIARLTRERDESTTIVDAVRGLIDGMCDDDSVPSRDIVLALKGANAKRERNNVVERAETTNAEPPWRTLIDVWQLTWSADGEECTRVDLLDDAQTVRALSDEDDSDTGCAAISFDCVVRLSEYKRAISRAEKAEAELLASNNAMREAVRGRDQRERERDEARAVLRDLEWSGLYGACQFCNGVENTTPHEADCRFSRALGSK